MNILFFGSDELLARVRKETHGQTWDIYRANDPDEVLAFEGTHVFQAALFGLCTEGSAIGSAVVNAKKTLDVPVAIGLASQDQAGEPCKILKYGLDIIVTECGNDRLIKLQCDAIVRIANGTRSERITCGGVSFHTSENRFSVNGQYIHLPQKKHKLLELLFLRRGRTVNKDMVFNHLYGWDEPPEIKIVDVFVCQIRRILREAGLNQDCIQTIWGQGYRVQEALSVEYDRAA